MISAFSQTQLNSDIDECTRGQSDQQYQLMLAEIDAWKVPSDDIESSSELTLAANIMKLAVLTFLHAAYYCCNPASVDFRNIVLPLVTEMFMQSGAIHNTPASATVLWPAIIIGPCATISAHQELFRQYLKDAMYEMPIVDLALQFLEWVWADEAGIIGPMGLEMIMKRHHIDFCMS